MVASIAAKTSEAVLTLKLFALLTVLTANTAEANWHEWWTYDGISGELASGLMRLLEAEKKQSNCNSVPKVQVIGE